MKSVLRWTTVALAGALAVLVGALLLIPLAVDVAPYRAALEKSLAELSGRPARVGELHLSLFPWVGVSLRGLSLANPAGFAAPDLLTVPAAELRVKLLPLLRREVQLDRVVLDGLRLELETAADGRSNWESDPAARRERPDRSPAPPVPPAVSPGIALFVNDLSLENAGVVFTDRRTGARHEFTGVRLQVRDVSFDRPVRLRLEAALNGLPVSGKGSVGPIGPNLGGGEVPVELSLTLSNELTARLSGAVGNVLVGPTANLALSVDDLSPRRLAAALGRPFPATTDPGVWERASLTALVHVHAHGLDLSNGALRLDDSQAEVRLSAPEWGKRPLSFDLHVDRLDLDRYLPATGRNSQPPAAIPSAAAKDESPAGRASRVPPLPPLKGTVAIDGLTCMHARLQQVALRVAGSEGVLTIDPVAAALYQGKGSGRAAVDLRSAAPRITIDATLEGVQAGPLLKDVLGREVLDGRTRAVLSLSMADQPTGLLRTLSGNGRVDVADGVLEGIDLLGSMRGGKPAAGERPHTDFSELTLPFTVDGGVMHISDAAAVAAPLHLKAGGQVDLVQETLNVKIEPRLAGEAGFGVVIAGRFSNPEIRPDLEGIARKALKKAIGADEESAGKVGDLLKGLLPKKKP